MNYVTEMYLKYLDEAEDYEAIYSVFAEHFILQEIPITAALAAQLKKLGADRAAAQASGNTGQIASIDAQIASLRSTATAPYATGTSTPAAIAQNKADIAGTTPPTPPPPTTPAAPPTTTGASGRGYDPATVDKAAAPGATPKTYDPASVDAAAKTPTGTSSADAIASNKANIKPSEVNPPMEDPTLAQQAADAAGQAGTAVKDVYGQAQTQVSKGAETLAGAVKTGGEKLGVDTSKIDPTQVAQAAVSPLGMAALGGAAAFGGYKLYKRFLSKSARACRGYSGSAKTGCMKSFMNAKKGQATTRGADVAAAT